MKVFKCLKEDKTGPIGIWESPLEGKSRKIGLPEGKI